MSTQKLALNVYSSIIPNGQKVACASTDKCFFEMDIHTLEYLAIRRNEVLLHAMHTWINPENILSEKSQLQKPMLYDSVHVKYQE